MFFVSTIIHIPLTKVVPKQLECWFFCLNIISIARSLEIVHNLFTNSLYINVSLDTLNSENEKTLGKLFSRDCSYKVFLPGGLGNFTFWAGVAICLAVSCISNRYPISLQILSSKSRFYFRNKQMVLYLHPNHFYPFGKYLHSMLSTKRTLNKIA